MAGLAGGAGGGQLGMKKGGRAKHKEDGGPSGLPSTGEDYRQDFIPHIGGGGSRRQAGGRFARGGRSEGEMPGHEKHWASYSDKNRKSKHGNSGESEELTLADPVYQSSHLKEADKRARGGKIGNPDAGALTGVGRLEKSKRTR